MQIFMFFFSQSGETFRQMIQGWPNGHKLLNLFGRRSVSRPPWLSWGALWLTWFTETCACPADWGTAPGPSSTGRGPGRSAAGSHRLCSTRRSPCSPPAGNTWTECSCWVTPTPGDRGGPVRTLVNMGPCTRCLLKYVGTRLFPASTFHFVNSCSQNPTKCFVRTSGYWLRRQW